MAADLSLLQGAAAAAAGAQHYPQPALYMVAVPIGNLADITLRAAQVLVLADVVVCEDTRVTAHLLARCGLPPRPLLAVHAHNEHEGAAQVLQRLAAGQRVVYVSDAGTPAVSDPGAALVAAAVAGGYRVLPVPGASSAMAAISVAGDALTQGFDMVGFLPAKGAARQQALAQALARPVAQVLFEAPHRVADLAAELATQAPERRVTVCRELTKQFETVHTAEARTLPAWMAAQSHGERGEFVWVVHAPAPVAREAQALPAQAEHTLRVLLAELPLKQAAALAAQISGQPRKLLYAQALAWRGEESPPSDES